MSVPTDRELVTAVVARDIEAHALRVDAVMDAAPVVVREDAW